MLVVSAIHASAAVLLVVAGAAKLSRPQQGWTSLLGFGVRPALVRLAGTVEAAVGLAALCVAGLATWGVGLLYAAFALIVWRGVLAGAGSCGCFGRLDAPPSWVHVAGNLVLAAASFAAAGTAGPPVVEIADLARSQPAAAVTLAVEIVVIAGLVLVAFTALPEALGARNARRRGPDLFGAVAGYAAGARGSRSEGSM